LRCTEGCYEDTLLFVEMKVIDSLLKIIEMYINEIKKKKMCLNEESIKTISIIFLNTGLDGSEAGLKRKKTNSNIILMKTMD
jgi:hypothetical protein